MSYYENAYKYGLLVTYVLYFLTFFRLWDSAPKYLSLFDYFFQLFVGLVLVYFFNPITRHRYGKIHKRIAFSAGIFLLTSTTLSAFMTNIKQLRELFPKM